jgi:hypothetical protein
MSKANLRSIHDQKDLSQTGRLGLQPLLSNQPVLLPHLDRRVLQKAAQALGGADQHRRTRDLDGNPAKVRRRL